MVFNRLVSRFAKLMLRFELLRSRRWEVLMSCWTTAWRDLIAGVLNWCAICMLV